MPNKKSERKTAARNLIFLAVVLLGIIYGLATK